jgi:hypothetical protein
MNETASLIGRLGSSAFRLSTVAVSMSLARPLFSPESAPRALPIWDPKTRWNNLARGLAVSNTAGPSGFTNSPHPSSRDSAHRCHAPKATYPASPPTIPQRLWDCGARSRPAHPRLFPKAKGTNDRDGGMQSRLFASAWHVDPAPSAYQVLLYKANSATARTTQAKIPTPNAGVNPWMGKRNPVTLVSAVVKRNSAVVTGKLSEANIPPTTISPLPIATRVMVTCKIVKAPTDTSCSR